ncbi:MAG: hypothetical protein JXB30_17305 [Anaerolineae bacterium]|nr:hypothetical protein [Anaerolineae bacterium]
MTTPLNEQDLILLNAYLDDELTARERANFESRLEKDEILQAEMKSLRSTAALLGMAQRVPVPHNFTLDPDVYGKPTRSSWWANLRIPALATAGVTVLVMLCIGVLIIRMEFGGAATSAPSVAQLEAASTEEPMEEPVEEATEEPTEEPAPATEAPAQEAETFGTHIPHQATAAAATGGGMDSSLTDDIQATERANGMVGGMGPGGTDVSAGEEQVELAAAEAKTPTTEAAAAEPRQADEEERSGEGDSAASLPPAELTEPKAYTMIEATATATTARDRSQVFDLSAKWAIPLIGILILASLLIVVAITIKRRRN